MHKPINSNRMYSYLFLSSFIAVSTVLIVFACTNSSSAKAKPNYVHKDAPKPGVAAKIGDQEISDEELIGESKLNLLDLEKQIYKLKLNRLKDLIVEKMVGKEAKNAGMSTEEYIEKKIAKGKLSVTDKDFKGFLKERGWTEEQVAQNPQIKDKIYSFLKDGKKDEVVQAYVVTLTKKTPVEVYFKKPKSNVEVPVGDSPLWGDKTAPVTIFEFSDFQCPFCKKGADVMKEVKKKYKGKVKVVFKHFPLPMHKDAPYASEASMCVYEQSPDKFWKFYGIIFENQTKLSKEDIEKYAKESGADIAKYKSCVEAKKYEGFIHSEMAFGEKLGIRSTPTFLINGEMVQGALPIESFSETIDDALSEAKN